MRTLCEISPKRTNAKALTLVIVLLGVGVGLLLFTPTVIPFVAAIYVVGVLLIAVAIGICGRYYWREYVYSVTEEEETGERFFTVTDVRRRGSVTVCRIESRELLAVLAPGSSKERAAARKEWQAVKKYNYTVDLSPKKVLCVYVEDALGGTAEVALSYDETFESALKTVLDRKRPPEA